jgi:hypothetical protein
LGNDENQAYTENLIYQLLTTKNMNDGFKYIDYLDIDKDFQAVFNEEVDRTHRNLWKTFIPHENFIKLLDTVIKALEREKRENLKSIWLYGAYGTGKSHAVFVLKHLLEDPDDEVEEYLKKFSDILGDTRIRKLMALRKQRVLVIFRSSAGHIDSSVKLLLEVQQSIYNACSKKLGSEFQATKTLIQHLLDRLNNEIINWDKLIEKYKNKLFDVSTTDDIRLRLERSDIEFATRFLDVLVEEGIAPIKFENVEDLKKWIKEILSQGAISKILFIWDEFSDFFRTNAPILTLQELAHLTDEIPFYLLLVTHRRPEHWSTTLAKDIDKLKDRFNTIYYTMEPITVYKLISQVIRPKGDSKDKWKSIREEILFAASKFGFKDEIYRILEKEKSTNIGIEDLKSILPIHPYTAFLASRIAEHFGSTNRTIFKFLREEDGFIKFLKEYPREKEFLLTADFLWDFFFVKNEDVLMSDPSLSSLMSLWREYESKLDTNELRIFKTIMILFAIKKRGLSEAGLLSPALMTLKVSLSGTSLYKELEKILLQLENKKAVKLIKDLRDDIAILEPSYGVDSEEIEKIKKGISFKDFVKEKIKFDEDSLRRAKIFVFTDQDILEKSLLPIEAKPYEVPIVIVLLEKLERLSDITDKVRKLAVENPGKIFVISRAELGESWDRIRENIAYCRYYSQIKKNEDARYHDKLVNSEIEKWKERIKGGALTVLVSLDSEIRENSVNGFEGLEKEFNYVVEKKFPYGYLLEQLISKEPLWKNKKLNSKSIEIGLNLKKMEKMEKSTTGALKPFKTIFVNDQIIDEEGNFIESQIEIKKNHPLLVMRKEIKELYNSRGQTLDLSEVWKRLQQPPYGLYDCPVGCFVFALLMREYCRGHYAVDQNNHEEELNYDNMARIINEVIRGVKNWRIQTISREQRDFYGFLNEAFSLNAGTPADAIKLLREKIKSDFRYPFWILNYVLQKDTPREVSEVVSILLDYLDVIVKSPLDKYNLEELKEHIKEVSKTLNSLDTWERNEVIKTIKNMTEKFPEAFRKFVEANFYNLSGLNISIDAIDKSLRERMQEEVYLWEEDKVKKMLNNMAAECKFVNNFSQIIGSEVYFLDELRDKFREKIEKGDFAPLWVFRHRLRDEKEKSIFAKIEEILYNTNMTPFEIDFASLELSGGIKNVFSDLNGAIENWLSLVFSEVDEQILDELKTEFKLITSKDPWISEEEAKKRLENKLKKIELKVLKNKIAGKLEEILGYGDFREFMKSKQVPVALVGYLPEFSGSKSKINFKEFVADLEHLEHLNEDGLKTILEYLRENEEAIKVLKDPYLVRKALKTFLGEKWYDKLFEESDLDDFFKYLNERLGDAKSWSEKSILENYEKWKKERYNQRFYPKVCEFLEKLDYEKIKQFTKKLSEDPDVGLKIINEMEKFAL